MSEQQMLLYIVTAALCQMMLFGFFHGAQPKAVEQAYNGFYFFSILLGFFFAYLGWLGLLTVWGMTGFAKHGFKLY